jgi:hypothetical protein
MSMTSHFDERNEAAGAGAALMALATGLSFLRDRAEAALRRRRDTHLLSEFDDNLLRDLGMVQARIETHRR